MKGLSLRGQLALLFMKRNSEFYYKLIKSLPWYRRPVAWRMLRLAVKRSRSEELREHRKIIKEALEEVDIFLEECGHEGSKS